MRSALPCALRSSFERMCYPCVLLRCDLNQVVGTITKRYGSGETGCAECCKCTYEVG